MRKSNWFFRLKRPDVSTHTLEIENGCGKMMNAWAESLEKGTGFGMTVWFMIGDDA